MHTSEKLKKLARYIELSTYPVNRKIVAVRLKERPGHLLAHHPVAVFY